MAFKFWRTILFFALFGLACASTAVSGSAFRSCDASEGQCTAEKKHEESRTPADRVLEEGARIQEITAQNIRSENIALDSDADVENVPGKKGNAFNDVFSSAFRQWIADDSDSSHNVKGLSPAAKRAIEEVQRRKGGAGQGGESFASQKQKTLSDLEDNMGESEVVVLEKAVLRLQKQFSEDVVKDLDLIEYLCHSGDNGNHLATIGGVEVLLSLVKSESRKAAHVVAVKALATCAQNNPAVFNRAVSDGAISTLVRLADETGNVTMRASALRALVSLRESDAAESALREEQGRLLRIIKRSVDLGVNGKDERRSVLRGLALVEPFLKINTAVWLPAVRSAGILDWCSSALSSPDADVRESAALLVKAAENASRL